MRINAPLRLLSMAAVAAMPLCNLLVPSAWRLQALSDLELDMRGSRVVDTRGWQQFDGPTGRWELPAETGNR